VFLPTCAYFIKNIQNSQSSARQTRFCFQAEKHLDAKFWDLLLARLHHLLQFLFTRKYSYMSFGLSSPALARQWIDRGEKESTADQAPKYSYILQHGRPTINVIKASSNVSIVNWRIYNFLLVKVVAFRRMR
jgi:hypothetical protein